VEGNLIQLNLEMENQKRNGKICSIKYYPKIYVYYFENKERKRKARELNSEAINNIADDFGGKVMPDW